mmetsp:Transcript_5293/g.6919  ORF Transcript_5293/g.6919 Transcript_5293/m.6919 type:complete len:136 (-) Transcript_5293:309-716(-)|eukprot:CAMPEP_0198139630 /NCGR_PEP_ID=MMETSP1443-20131203/2908_1 /TAXON_ID=186043 /ORGANISM="Entomoneis sp., Strain CCMP2396" /LENGTH=135 /DNA_ID=CAMNT_0043801819 /DNA_START=108 /DNA_END=515 /DNA_ORIENTATION=-
MSFRPDTTTIKQDMPPPGGFPKIDLFERARTRGPSGPMIWAIATASIAYGFVMIGESNKQFNREKFLEHKNRLAMVPFLQAETDLDWLARREKWLAREAEIMKGVDGWEVGKSMYYTSGHWVPDPPFRLQKWYKK